MSLRPIRIGELKDELSGQGAIIEGPYRYFLWDIWDRRKPVVGFVMTNPSYADGKRSDLTWTRCREDFAKPWGMGGAVVANLRAWISPNPMDLWDQTKDTRGPKNARYLERILSADVVVAAWGHAGAPWAEEFLDLVAHYGRQLWTLGLTKRGYPTHPLARGKYRVPSGKRLKVWKALDVRSEAD